MRPFALAQDALESGEPFGRSGPYSGQAGRIGLDDGERVGSRLARVERAHSEAAVERRAEEPKEMGHFDPVVGMGVVGLAHQRQIGANSLNMCSTCLFSEANSLSAL